MKKNLFIALEGIDGSGKSTQAAMLAAALEAAGHPIHCTEEPTRGPIGSMIRRVFRHEAEADHRVIAGLFVADRLEHLLHRDNGILRLLSEGITVITDRYYFSSYAYQGVHVSPDWVIAANSLSAGLRRPDLNVFIDIDPDIAMQRIQATRRTVELYETRENLSAVRDLYFRAFDLLKDEERIFITNGNRPAGEIAADILQAVLALA